jgi:photosystem II stability/assembly factor-like uncharacterized protein
MRPLALARLFAAALAIAVFSGCGAAAAPKATHVITSSKTIAGTRSSSVRPAFVPLSFTAVSVSHWWVLGAVPCGARDCLSVKTTTNGGATFRSLPAPPVTFAPGAMPAPWSIRFADAQDGWVFGPKLYATHDGGLRWTAIRMPGVVAQLQPGLGRVYAAVVPASPRCAETGTCSARTPRPQLWRTLPSGNHWTADRAAGAVSGELAVHGTSVWVVNAMLTRDGYALGSRLLHSANAGSTFTLEPQPITGIYCEYSPVSDSFLWAYCSGGHFMFPYVSSDGGAHFTAVGSQTARITPVGYANGSGLVPASASTAVAASDLSVPKVGDPLIRTTDEGARWKIVAAQPTRNGQWLLIGFTTPKVGYAFWQSSAHGYATASLWRTIDAGAKWTLVKALT